VYMIFGFFIQMIVRLTNSFSWFWKY